MKPIQNLYIQPTSPSEFFLSWDILDDHVKFEIFRYKKDILDFHALLGMSEPTRMGVQYSYVDNTGLIPDTIYGYELIAYDALNRSEKSSRVFATYDTIPPMPVANITSTRQSDGKIYVGWANYPAPLDIYLYEIYIETSSFNSILGLSPKSTAADKEIVIDSLSPFQNYYIGIVPVDLIGNKVASVFPVFVPALNNLPGPNNLVFSSSIYPHAAEPGEVITVFLSNALPNENYDIYIGNSLLGPKLHTDSSGTGKLDTTLPFSIHDGRHSVIADNKNGSVSTLNEKILVPFRVSPNEEKIKINGSYRMNRKNVRIQEINVYSRLNKQDTIKFMFLKDEDPKHFNLDTKNIFLRTKKHSIFFENSENEEKGNLKIDYLPNFSYPPFVTNSKGRLSVFGLVQKTDFATSEDWARNISEVHKRNTGTQFVVASIIQVDPISQNYEQATIRTIGDRYENSFRLIEGNSYILEVIEPVQKYVISSYGYVNFKYDDFVAIPGSNSSNMIVLVCDGKFKFAKEWAEAINQHHLNNGGVARVVSSAAPWNGDSQSFSDALIDIGNAYENDLLLIPGSGYLLDVKEKVSAFTLTGDSFAQ